ncbi:NrsF family protein [Magnetospirillum moscoviense]|uniref:DUF1109 domain-containing protein n=1 Tax=Magnetospirillum moscoviense TaxID=1437059 RepID=A0A178MPF0_9PROT|nr:NrsF family protein [Magnetospirillum moscoviense]MBF0325016.1 DUF1109 family protein [Alphaproteobacteria bacterium]OAN49834.1 hypothetical protein A6A05_12985 [Magnetospirillum moscoviense]
MNTDTLIRDLTDHLTPVEPLPSPAVRLGRWLALALPVLAVLVWLEGPRADLAQRLGDPRFLLGLIAALATGVSAGWAALASTVPGLPGIRQAVPLIPAALWLAVTGDGCWRQWLVQGPDALAGIGTPQCFPEILMAGALPALALVWLARKGASLHPARTAALAALAAAALGTAALELFHHSETAIIALVWHLGAVAAMSGLAALAGGRLFRSL